MQNLTHYLDEARFAARSSRGSFALCGLLWDTGLFHLGNAVRLPGAVTLGARERKWRRHRLRLAGRAVDLWMRPYNGDLFVFYEVFMGHAYHVPDALARGLRALGDEHQGLNIVDLGANVGLTTAYLSLYFPGSRFACVEPHPDNLALLKRNAGLLGQRVRVMEGAAAASSGAWMFDTSAPSWGGRLLKEGSGVQVASFSIPDIMARSEFGTVDLLKVDIEGAEQQIFGSNTQWLEHVNLIAIELHGSYTLQDFAHDVAPFGFKVYPPGAVGNHVILAVSQRLRQSAQSFSAQDFGD